MNLLRSTAIALSLLIHGSIGYAMLPALQRSDSEVIDLGKGTDIILVQGGTEAEGVNKGDALETLETAEITPMEATPPPPPKEVKPDELHDVITSDASEVEQDIVKTEEPPPPPLDKPPPPPEVVQTKTQPAQVAVQELKSSGEASGGDAKAFGLYMSKINDNVQRAKINPRSSVAGTVVLRFTIGVDGQLLSKEVAASSGSKVLDDAATASLDRAAPFPPIPPEVSIKPLAFTQPFKFMMR